MFRCSGFRVNDISEGQQGDRGGDQKMAKIQYGVKPDIFKRAAQNGQNFWWGEISTFWASSSAKKVLLTAEKVASAQN